MNCRTATEPTCQHPFAAAKACRGVLHCLVRLTCICAFFVLGGVLPHAQAETRVAVVIGNAAYPFAPLGNPKNDATAIAAALRRKGFVVFEVLDAGRQQMTTAIAQAADALRGRSGVGVLYFAGHGLQVDWHNYLVPVDARIESAEDVRRQAVDIQTAIDAFRLAGNRVSIFVLDACRDNPFGASSSGRGLAHMDAPAGTLLAYATAPGNVAEDGDAGNGLYTRHLVREIEQPGLAVEDVFKHVRLQVRRQSAGRQIPWESTSLEDDFYFDPTIEVVTLARAEIAARDEIDWRNVENSMQEDDFADYLQRQPTGRHVEEARAYLNQLKALHARGRNTLPAANNRFTIGDEFEYVSIDGYTKLRTPILLRVTFADDDRAEFDGGRIVQTQTGGVLRDLMGAHRPARVDSPGDLAVGKTWRSTYRTTNSRSADAEAFCDNKVVALEAVTVPAGTFTAYRIERAGESNGWGVPSFKVTTWVEPSTMLSVREDVLVRVHGRIDVWRMLELVSVKRVKRRSQPPATP